MLTFLIVLAVLAAVTGATVWWRRRRRPGREVTMNTSYERAKGQAYLQGQSTRDNIGNPFQ